MACHTVSELSAPMTAKVLIGQVRSTFGQLPDMRQGGSNNASALFGVHQIPSDAQIRNLLDPVEPVHLEPLFIETVALVPSAASRTCAGRASSASRTPTALPAICRCGAALTPCWRMGAS